MSWEGLLPGSSSLVAKCIPVFVKVRSSIVQLRVPTYNQDKFVLHCCFGFSACARNHVTVRASSWLVNAVQKSAKVQIFPQDCLSHLCIGLTCKSFARNASFTSGVNRVGYRLGFFRYRCQIDTFKMVPVPEPILIKNKNYQLIIGLAISTKHMGPVSQTHRQGLD